MYNGIGLSTPRGSSTSGHVQRNYAAVPKKERQLEEIKSESINRMPNLDILEHNRKRKIEIECIELSDKLEDQGYTQEQIDKKVDAFRKIKLEDYEKSSKYEELGDSKNRDSHQTKQKKNSKVEVFD